MPGLSLRPNLIADRSLIIGSNSRYFMRPNGPHVVLAGSHTWSNLQDVTYSVNPSPPAMDFDVYLSRLQSWGHNCFRLWPWESALIADRRVAGQNQTQTPMPYQRTGPGNANDGGLKFDLTLFNQSYFDRIRTRTLAAKALNIFVIVMLFNGFSVENKSGGEQAWNCHPFNSANNINSIDGGGNLVCHTLQAGSPVTTLQEAYVAKLIDTVGDLSNVMWEITNEDTGSTNNTSWQNHMIDYMRTYEAARPMRHPIGFTVQYPSGSDATLLASSADWISPAGSDGVPTSPSGAKVYLLDTDHNYYWVTMRNDGQASQRAWAWKAACLGNNLLFMDPYLDPSAGVGRNSPSGNNVDAYWDVLRYAMGDARSYVERLTLANCTPQGSLASTGYCLAWTGNEYLAYQPGNGAFTVNLVAGTYNHEWYDPEARTIAATGQTVATGGNKSFTPPFAGDAVLLLKVA